MKYIFLFILLSLVALTGCFGETQGETTSQGPREAGKKEEIEKWNLYVDLSNYLEADLNPALDDYLRIFGYSPEYRPANEPEYIADLLSAMVASEELTREIDKALAKAAKADNDLDQATYEMGLQLKQLWASLAKARDYYSAPAGRPTDEEAAREAHANIYEAYLALESSRGRFWELLSKEDSERRKRDIQEMGLRGLNLRPAMLKLLDDGQALQDLLSSRNINSASLRNLNPDDYRPLYDRFAASIAEYDQLLDKTGNPAGEGLNSADLEKFSQYAWVTLASANQLIEYLEGVNPGEGNPEDISGTPEHFAHRLWVLVDLYNVITH